MSDSRGDAGEPIPENEDSALHRKVEGLFHAALDMPAEERGAFLTESCGGDERLRAEVEALVDARERAPGSLAELASPVPIPAEDAARSAFPGDSEEESLAGSSIESRSHLASGPKRPGEPGHPDRIGPYRIRSRIGEGGMGTVYLAEQEEPVHRLAALKVIKLGMDTREVLARFDAERQALALMNHPNIARVYEAGATTDGRPFFAMEYVQGVPITEYCDQKKMGVRDRLHLFMQVCDAVQHAHQKGIIHRDIKPSNVLVHQEEGDAVPKVIDFGIAKATNQKLTERTVFTAQGQIIGTLEYMSPEQAEMTAEGIDTRSDIYSLGVLLYELLVGERPFDSHALRKAGYVEILRIIREEEPSKPSTRLDAALDDSTTIANRRGTEISRLRRQIRGDLDWITLKALEKERVRRYDSASALSADIQRYLDSEPIIARPRSASYLVRKFVGKNLGAVMAVAAVILTLISGLTWALIERGRADTEASNAVAEAEEARRQRDNALATSGFMEEVFLGIAPEIAVGRDTVLLESLMDKAAVRLLKGELGHAPEVACVLRSQIGGVYRNLGEFQKAQEILEGLEEIARAAKGEVSELYETAVSAKAALFGDMGEFERSLALREKELAIARKLHPGDHVHVAGALRELALTLGDLRRALDAATHYRESIAMYKRLGEKMELRRALLGLAVSLSDPEERLAAVEEFLTLQRMLIPTDHPDLASGLGTKGHCLQSLGRLDAAGQAMEDSLAMTARVYGEDHAAVAKSHALLANFKLSLDKFREAAIHYKRAVEIGESAFPEGHPDTAYDYHNLAVCLKRSGNFEEALSYAKKGVNLCEKILPSDNAVALSSILGLALVQQRLDRQDEAEITLVQLAGRLQKFDQPSQLSKAAYDAFEELYKSRGTPEKLDRYSHLKLPDE